MAELGKFRYGVEETREHSIVTLVFFSVVWYLSYLGLLSKEREGEKTVALSLLSTS